MANPIAGGNGNGNGFPDEQAELSEFIQQTDEARAVAQPANVSEFWIEKEFGEGQVEQVLAHAEKAEGKAADPDSVAAELSHEADKAESESNDLSEAATDARENLGLAQRVLEPHLRRPSDAKLTYWLTRVLILLGDIAGIGGAALLIGEEPMYAFMQATSAAVSAVTLGGVGREVRYLMAARLRQKPSDDLSEDEQQFASWFGDPAVAERYVKIVALACAAGLMVLSTGIFALRSVAEGFWPALAFWGFATALGLASFYNSFTNADEVAEHLEGRAAKVKKAEKRAKQARQEPVIGRRARATAEGESIRKVGELAGAAAAAGLGRGLYHVLGHSPGVAGNGVGARRRANGGQPEKAAKNGKGG